MFGSDTTTSAVSSATSLNMNGENGKAQKEVGVSLETFLASLSVAAVVFGVELGVFIIARKKMQRIYEPRTYLVPEKRRTPISGSGLFDWLKPIFATSTSEFISKSGLDAYFFLRYLLMLLKIFVLLACVILPILLPLNSIGGKGESDPNEPVKGMDKLAWTNVSREKTDRYWAHLFLAIFVVVLCGYMFYRELRGYIRLRQAYLTSPQHRLRASATTVLVTSVPRKWLTIDALLGLYDVFPGGVRNIWINRDYHDLNEKVKLRNNMAKKLERAETDLIRLAKKRNNKKMRKLAKSDPESQAVPINTDMSEIGGGVSSGNPHENSKEKEKEVDPTSPGRKSRFNIPIVGGVMNTGIDRINSGFKDVGKVVKDIIPGNHQTHGFVADPDLDTRPGLEKRHSSLTFGPPTRGTTIERHRSYTGEEDNQRPPPTAIQQQKKPWDGKLEGGDEDDGRPLAVVSPTDNAPKDTAPIGGKFAPVISPIVKMFKGREDNTVYPQAYNPEFQDDSYGEPVWKKYLSEKDRPTHRLPLASFLPALPLIGQKVDTIHYCRKEIARLNVEIEHDQTQPEKYPLMNSAFIQFNNQVAAHMACQSLNHHLPQQMGPRYLEVNPNDVLWENMRIKWWERYLRSMLVTAMVGGLIIGWAAPVAFVGFISQITYLTDKFHFLAFLKNFPDWLLGLISGVLPPIGLAILMALLPIILRTFARIQGLHTGMSVELAVQGMYFAFLFVQVFLVVSISSGFTTVFEKITDNPTSAAGILAENLPKASNFFFSYLLLQAFAQSGGALVQIGSLIVYYLLAPFVDYTARQKWARQVALPEMQWGTFFPIYTNLACIGLVYSVISPLILVFNIFTFGLFWMVYRYNLLFVNNYKFDTGGLLFPKAINQLFTGLYVMEICLIGLFFLVRDEDGEIICFPQGVIMFVVVILTILYQQTLNKAFGPLLTYLPITLEDNAVIRDKEFAKENDERRRLALVEDEEDGEDLNDLLERREKQEVAEDRRAEDIELREIEADNEAKKTGEQPALRRDEPQRDRWTASKPLHGLGLSSAANTATTQMKKLNPFSPRTLEMFRLEKKQKDLEDAQIASIRRANRAEFALFDDIPDEIEDLSPEERDRLVERAFQHSALRAKRPVIWIPRDDLGISDDEIYRTRRFSRHVWVSNEYAGLDVKNRVVYKRSPPDFDARDLVEL